MTIVGIHQPMYLPYLGVFNKMKSVDVFVFLDDAEYSSGYYYNRNRIKGPNGELMLTVPVMKKKGIRLNEIKIAQNIRWQEKHMKSLITCYEKSDYFKDYKDFFEEVYNTKWEKLHELNMKTMLYIIERLDIEIPTYFSSELLKDYRSSGTQRLVDICIKLDADVYLSGIGGRDYLETGLFDENDVRIEYQNYSPREYKQLYPPFIPNLSIIDLLFNVDNKAKDMI